MQVLREHTDDVIGIDFADNGLLLATGSDDQSCRLWDVRTWQCLEVLRHPAGQIKRVAFAPGSGYLATSSADTTVRYVYLSLPLSLCLPSTEQGLQTVGSDQGCHRVRQCAFGAHRPRL